MCAPKRRWSATLSPAYVGVSWRDVPDLASGRGRPAGRSPSTSISPAVGVSIPTARLSRVVLPAPLGPTSPTTRPGGTSSVQSESAQRGGTACRARRLAGRCSCGLLLGAEKGAVEQRLDALLVEPGLSRPASQRSRSSRSGPCAASVSSASVRVTNVPTPGRAATSPSCSSSR